MLTGRTSLYGLMGNPVAQSFSPLIQNRFAQGMGIDMVYTTFHVHEGMLENAVKGVFGLDIKGFNVTVPYKMDIIPFLDEIKAEAEIIGAVNTVKKVGNRLVGYNTDWLGLKTSLEMNDVSLEGKNVVIIGAGGAARAVAVMCANMKAAKIVIANRTAQNAEAIARVISKHYNVEVEVIKPLELKVRTDLPIAFQTTSVGMYPNTENNPVYETDFYKQIDVAVDLIYNPAETHFLKEARLAGARTINGMGMLFYQGASAFEIWTDTKLSEDILSETYCAFEEAVMSK